jgi:TonB family protein|tara:strand:+ start:268 stop:1245 length:978 start_codon:yes stop_codon:yes gene_type:complete
LVARGARGRGFPDTRKKSSSGGLTVFLILLLLGSVGFSIYLYQENTRTKGIITALKVQNSDLSSQTKSSTDKMSALENQIKENQYFIETLDYEFGLLNKEKTILDKEKTILERENRDLIEKNNELENQLLILRLTVNDKPQNADEQIPDQKELNEITSLLDSFKKERDEQKTKAAALETIVNTKNSEILDLQVKLAQSNDQFAVLSNQVNDLRTQLSIPIISISPPQSQTSKTCDITKAKLLKRPAPTYPRRALERGIEGTVKVQMDVSASGKPINITVVSSANSILTNAAISAAKKIEFKPAEDCNGNFVIEKGVTSSYKFAFT